MRFRNRAPSEADLVRRLATCLPAATFELETFCHLAGLRVTRGIPSAAIECRARPRLLINPDFVQTDCGRDEHLFLLVMDELWHVLLGHTRLFPGPPRPTTWPSMPSSTPACAANFPARSIGGSSST